MNRFYAIILLSCTTIVFPPSAAKAAGQQTAPPKTSARLTIPAGAVANPDNTWSYTDKQGKHWIYTKTPSGVTRVAAPAALKTVPEGAVRNPNGTYSWTDPQGKKWLFTNTPFGLSRTSVPDQPRSQSAADDWKVTDKGDTVRFERRSPMGPVVWEKKKTELNEHERQVYESQKAAPKQ